MGLNQYEEALTRLVHAHNLALEQHRNFGDDITSVIRLARKKRFEAMDEDRQKEEISLQVIVLFIKKMVFNMNDNGYVPEFVIPSFYAHLVES